MNDRFQPAASARHDPPDGPRAGGRGVLRGAALALLLLAGGALAQLDVAATGDQRVSNLRLPLQRHPNGRVKELFLARHGEMTPEGRFKVDGGIVLLLLDENGLTNGIARGESGFYDRGSNYAECIGPVSLDLRSKGVLLEGTNLVWDSGATLLRIPTHAVLTLNRGGRSAVDAFAR